MSGLEQKVKVKTWLGSAGGEREVDVSRLGQKILYKTLKEVVVMYEANLRQGTRSTKERSEVKGSGKKPYRQKHTGRARAGSFQSPIWRGGGVVFGPKPRDFHYHLPKKMKIAALKSALLGKFRDSEVVVVDGLPAGKPSTKEAAKLLKDAGVDKSALVVIPKHDEIVYKSFRNIPGVEVKVLADLNAYHVLRRRHLVLTPEVLDCIEKGDIRGQALKEVENG